MLIHVGLPENTGHLPRVAAAHGFPCLVSAGRMWRGGRFRSPGRATDAIKDLALDSAGFVAMVHHGGYPWSVAQYVGLVATSPRWAWWSQMDLCCEQEIARDRETVTARVSGTAALLKECREVALDKGISAPLPVLQGRHPDDYEESASLADDVLGGVWPDLVGVGSVCRRDLAGPDGVLAIVGRLARVLPSHVRFHLFGQKGNSIPELAACSRVASLDSCAWDARYRHQLGDRRRDLMRRSGLGLREATAAIRSSTVERGAAMVEWYRASVELERSGNKARQPSLFWSAL